MNHIMLDLETFDSSPTAMIVSIGAVKMDLERFKLTGEEFYQIVRPGLYGTIGPDTVLWWLQQSVEAQKMFRAPAEKMMELPEALNKFSLWITGEGVQTNPDPPAIWGNGATFDNVILRHAYQLCCIPAPWSYRHGFCYRTMYRNFPGNKPYEKQGVQHNALDDAKSQALALINIMRRLKK
jgi:hypothetical protein